MKDQYTLIEQSLLVYTNNTLIYSKDFYSISSSLFLIINLTHMHNIEHNTCVGEILNHCNIHNKYVGKTNNTNKEYFKAILAQKYNSISQERQNKRSFVDPQLWCNFSLSFK